MRNFLPLVAAACMSLLGACAAPNGAAAPPDVEVPHAGLTPTVVLSGVVTIVGETVDTPAGRTAAGKVSEHGGVKLLQSTKVLEAKKGVAFGFVYRLSGRHEGPLHGLEMQALHPPMRGGDGKAHTSSTAPTHAYFESGTADGDITYLLAEDFEVLSGVWTLRLLLDGKVLISRTYLLR